jgi:hypothetical protein
LLKVLTREDKSSGSLLASYGVYERGNGLLGISRSVNIEVGEYTKTRNSLNRLMGRTIFTNTDRVVGKNVGNVVELSKRGNTDGGAEVINENGEGRSRGLEETVVTESVKDASHGMFTDTEVQVLSRVGLVEASTEVSSTINVVTA